MRSCSWLRYRRGLGHDIFDQKYIVWAALGITAVPPRGHCESKIDDVEILPIRSRSILGYWVGERREEGGGGSCLRLLSLLVLQSPVCAVGSFNKRKIGP